jgi:hypothetical protein
MSKVYLKVKIMSLAAEAKIIRREEELQRNHLIDGSQSSVFWGLRGHRCGVVRNEARVALVAYGYIRGRTYDQLETNPKSEPNWSRVATLAVRYGDDKKVTVEHVKTWAEARTLARIAA